MLKVRARGFFLRLQKRFFRQLVDASEPGEQHAPNAGDGEGSQAAGHYGPHWFLLLLPHTSRRGGLLCCRRLHQALESTHPPGGIGPVRAYFGIAAYSAEKRSPQALLREAEEHLALARAETCGRVVGGPGDPAPA